MSRLSVMPGILMNIASHHRPTICSRRLPLPEPASTGGLFLFFPTAPSQKGLWDCWVSHTNIVEWGLFVFLLFLLVFLVLQYKATSGDHCWELAASQNVNIYLGFWVHFMTFTPKQNFIWTH